MGCPMFVKFLAIVLCVLNVYTTASTFLDVLDCKESSKLNARILNHIELGDLYLFRFGDGAVWQIMRLEDFKEVAVI